jgi:hypothetical protein
MRRRIMKTLAPLAAVTAALACSTAFAQLPLSSPPQKMTIHTAESLNKAVEERKAKEAKEGKQAPKGEATPAAVPKVDNGAPDTAEGRYLPKWVLLRDGQMRFGEVMKDAVGYLFRSSGARMRLSAMQVEAVADTKADIYRYKKNRIPPNDLEERLELAKWCYRQHLIDEAKAETTAVLAIDSQHAQAKKLLKNLDVTEAPSMSSSDNGAKLGGAGIGAEADGFGEDSLRMFTNQVHHIIRNKCGTCHGNPRHESDYKLSNRRITHSVTKKNFQATELLVDLRNPGKSKLLEMALTPHGNPKVALAPFGGPHDEGFKALRKWTFMLAKNWQEAFAEPEGMPQIAADKLPDLPARRPTAAPAAKKTAVASKMKPAPEKPGFGTAAADDAPQERPSLLQAPKKTAKPKKEEGDPLNPDAFNEGNGGQPSPAPQPAKKSQKTIKEQPKSNDGSAPQSDLYKDVYEGTPPSWKTQKKSD